MNFGVNFNKFSNLCQSWSKTKKLSGRDGRQTAELALLKTVLRPATIDEMPGPRQGLNRAFQLELLCNRRTEGMLYCFGN